MKKGKSLGYFVFIFDKENSLNNVDFLEIYLSQLELFLEKTNIENSLRLSQKRFFTLAEHAPVGFVSCNINGDIMYKNKRLLDIIGCPSEEEFINTNLFENNVLKNRGFTDKLKECIEEDKKITYEMGYRSLWGKSCWLRIHLKPHKDYGKIIGVNMVIDDITNKKQTEEILKEKAFQDPLTRTYNRNAIDEVLLNRLKKADNNNLKSCLAILDIDDFKEINDNYGHLIGDKILEYMSARIKDELREKDLLIRTGGDEFLIYLHDIKNEKNATYFIKRIFEKCSSTYVVEDEHSSKNYNLKVSCSIGTSFFPKDGKSVEKLFSAADLSLYEIKNMGKNGYIEL
jgi:diguanylate cyclase (GGDEF)-like protein/PAS domain S-box-containing protein